MLGQCVGPHVLHLLDIGFVQTVSEKKLGLILDPHATLHVDEQSLPEHRSFHSDLQFTGTSKLQLIASKLGASG